MTRKDILELKAAHAKTGATFKFHSSALVATPYAKKRGTIADSAPCAVFYAAFTNTVNVEKAFVAALVYTGQAYELRCGDLYLEGRLTPATRSKMIAVAANKAPPENIDKAKKLLFKSYGTLPQCISCDTTGARKGAVCEHEAHLLSLITPEKLDEIEKFQLQFFKEDTGAPDNLDKTFERYAFKKHLLIEGDKGSGKTWFVQQWCKKNRVKSIFVGGHEQFESIDFLSHYLKTDSGQLLWKDGPLSEAFRSAAEGEKTVLIVDEMLRIPRRELNILISTLSPIGGFYTLRTGRAQKSADGLANEEVLRAPQERLWVLGTTNVGTGYAVDEMDDALMDRFKPFRKETTEEDLRAVLTRTANDRGFSQNVAAQLIDFYRKMTVLKESGTLGRIVNLRHLNEALLYAENENAVVDHIRDSILLWADRLPSGHPDTVQTKAIHKVIAAVWSRNDD